MSSDSPVELRLATADDVDFVWRVNNHPSVREQSLTIATIPWEQHVEWFASKLSSSSTIFFIAERDRSPVATVRFDLEGEHDATISVAVSPAYRSRGIGTHTIRAGTETFARAHPDRAITACIRATNVASLTAFRRAGYEFERSEHRDGLDLERYRYAHISRIER